MLETTHLCFGRGVNHNLFVDGILWTSKKDDFSQFCTGRRISPAFKQGNPFKGAQYLQMDPLFKVDTCHALQLWSKDSGDDVGGCVFYLFWSQRAFDFVHMLKKLMVVYGAVSKANSINHLNLNSVSKIGHHPYIGKGQKQ